MTNPSDHEINEVLARVAGVKITFDDAVCEWFISKVTADCGISHSIIHGKDCVVHYGPVWNPLHDANQMEMVEAWLMKNGWSISIDIHTYNSITVCAAVYKIRGKDNLPQYYKAINHDKKRALALAIQEMEQCDNIRKNAPQVS